MTTVTDILGACDTPVAIEVCFLANNWRRLDRHKGQPVPIMGLSDAIARINALCADHTITDPVFSLRAVHAHTGEHLWPSKDDPKP